MQFTVLDGVLLYFLLLTFGPYFLEAAVILLQQIQALFFGMSTTTALEMWIQLNHLMILSNLADGVYCHNKY